MILEKEIRTILYLTNANGRKYHVIMIFPPFSLLTSGKEDCLYVRKQCEYLFDLLNRSAELTTLFSSPKLSYFMLYI